MNYFQEELEKRSSIEVDYELENIDSNKDKRLKSFKDMNEEEIN